MIISNSSPLIALAKIGRFKLLSNLFKEIYISKAVHIEVVVHGKEKTGEKEVTHGIKRGWIKVLEVRENESLMHFYLVKEKEKPSHWQKREKQGV